MPSAVLTSHFVGFLIRLLICTPLLHSRCLLVRCQRESVRVYCKHWAVYTRIDDGTNEPYRFLSVWAILLDTYNIFWLREWFVGAIWHFDQRQLSDKCHCSTTLVMFLPLFGGRFNRIQISDFTDSIHFELMKNYYFFKLKTWFF